ncbi:MAG: PD-(D/E)XK nuclease family protein [bacterium]
MKQLLAQIVGWLFPKQKKLDLSYSKVRTYSECPYRYYLVYVKRFRSPPTAHSSLGHSIHKALELYHAHKGSSWDDLLQAYDDGWEHEGYADAGESMEFYQRGEEILKKYFDNEKESKSDILYTEKDFRIDLGFCFLRGVIDRVDRLQDGRIELIDYKTNKKIIKKKVLKNDLQLTVYNFACREELNLKPDILTYYFLSHGRKISAVRTRTDEKKLFKILKDTSKKINKKKFKASTRFCWKCDFKGRCEYADKKD